MGSPPRPPLRPAGGDPPDAFHLGTVDRPPGATNAGAAAPHSRGWGCSDAWPGTVCIAHSSCEGSGDDSASRPSRVRGRGWSPWSVPFRLRSLSAQPRCPLLLSVISSPVFLLAFMVFSRAGEQTPEPSGGRRPGNVTAGGLSFSTSWGGWG